MRITRERKQVRLPSLRGAAEQRGCRPRVGRWFVSGAAVGAASAYLLDPERGRRRRRIGRDRVVGVYHRLVTRAGRKAHTTIARTQGHAHGLVHLLKPGSVEELDDIALAHKVESIVFRDPRVPKGRISINAESGRVYLRGQVEPDLVADLEKAVRRVRGVRDVENLLHPPGTPTPERQSTRPPRE